MSKKYNLKIEMNQKENKKNALYVDGTVLMAELREELHHIYVNSKD